VSFHATASGKGQLSSSHHGPHGFLGQAGEFYWSMESRAQVLALGMEHSPGLAEPGSCVCELLSYLSPRKDRLVSSPCNRGFNFSDAPHPWVQVEGMGQI